MFILDTVVFILHKLLNPVKPVKNQFFARVAKISQNLRNFAAQVNFAGHFSITSQFLRAILTGRAIFTEVDNFHRPFRKGCKNLATLLP